MTRNLKLTN